MLLKKILLVVLVFLSGNAATVRAQVVDSSGLRGKVLCGYQGWFRCPGDAAELGWIHWSRDPNRLAPDSLTFEMWPDLTEFPASGRFPAPGFTGEDGGPAYLFSSADPGTVRRHFEWMRQYGLDGVWLQHFAVDLPGGPARERYASRSKVLENVRQAARGTGRVWALAFDIAGMPSEKIVEVVTAEWRRLVDAGVMADERYVHEGGKPVVQVWGFYYKNAGNAMTPAVGNALIDFFKKPGPHQAYLIGGGDWDWRSNPDPAWQAMFRRFDAFSPWNVGNYSRDAEGIVHAATDSWAEDQKECARAGMRWLPVIYPGFSWDNLQKKPPGSTEIPRRGGDFLWEQFHKLSALGADSACLAMFDEVDEGTAVFKVTSHPPREAHFLTFGDKPSDWYLRLTGEGTRLLRTKTPVPPHIPLQP